MAYPQPSLDVIEQINDGLDGIDSDINRVTGNINALWDEQPGGPLR